MKWTRCRIFNVWEKKKRDVVPRLSIGIGINRFESPVSYNKFKLQKFLLNGKIVSFFFRLLLSSLCALSIFFTAIEILITSFMVVPNNAHIDRSILIEFNFFSFFLHDWLMKSYVYEANEKKNLFLLSRSHLSLVLIRLVFNKYSPWNIKFFFFVLSNQLIVFYWVISQNVEHDSCSQKFSSNL